MEVRIAHLSDIHFGTDFSLATWKSVKTEIVRFSPNLILVTGDLVDHPSPLHLIAAKCELQSLADECDAQFYAVPGNHDVQEYGNRLKWGPSKRSRPNWFSRIFWAGDTREAQEALERELGERPGFTEKYRSCPDRRGLRSLRRLRYLVPAFCKGNKDFTRLLPKTPNKPHVVDVSGLPILIATIDSNAPHKAIGFATGCVSSDDLQALQRELQGAKRAHLARIAMVHHHLLPIAFSDGQIIGGEPLMVLQNAGTVLSVLTDKRFDLILHGHKHVPQVATIDLNPGRFDSCPITVASAGSAALSANSPRTNALNFITLNDNGQIIIDSLPYGGPAAPALNKKVTVYREPLESAKRRAFARAVERQPLRTRHRLLRFEVTEAGDLLMTQKIEEMVFCREPQRCRPYWISPPTGGRVVESALKLDSTSAEAGYSIRPNPDTPHQYFIDFPGGPNETVSYAFSSAVANGIMMTRWEADQRRPLPSPQRAPEDSWSDEWVSVTVGHPIETLTLELKLPDSLRHIRPFVRCRRHREFPEFDLDEHGDARIEGSGTDFIEDQSMHEAEKENLKYTEDQSWRLTISLPLVGYKYQLRWNLPDDPADPRNVRGKTEDIRNNLLTMRQTATAAGIPLESISAKFAAFCADLQGLLKEPNAGNFSATLFVYDSSRTALRPVLGCQFGAPPTVPDDFEIPLGHGVSGAAFQQRRIVPWFDCQTNKEFIQPLSQPEECGGPLKSIMAIPVYHPDYKDTPRPPAWATIGSLTFGTTRSGSLISEATDQINSLSNIEWIDVARLSAHAITLAADHELTHNQL